MAQLPAPEYLRTLNRFPGDGSTTIFNFTFTGGYIAREHVKAEILDADTLLTKRVQVITSDDWIGPFQLRILPAPGASEILVIYRDTPKDLPLVDFTDGAILNEPNLDKNARQAVFIAAEMVDRITQALLITAAAAAVAVDAKLAAQAAAAAAQLIASQLGDLSSALAQASAAAVTATTAADIAVAAAAAVAPSVMTNHLQVATSDYTLPTGRNGLSLGPITINPGVDVVIPPTSHWKIL